MVIPSNAIAAFILLVPFARGWNVIGVSVMV